MKINKICLNNFGSYQGEAVFETMTQNEKNIIIIGGKNGAGKTTLFTAIRVCLYGFVSMGHKAKNAYYNREIIKLINNAAKLRKPTNAGVELYIQLSNGQGVDEYKISRSWILSDGLQEAVTVEKNQKILSSEATDDFQKYIFSLIPPDLFNIFFFDGEKIADFFMSEGADNRIKKAFLTLCGYDTFEIMRRNFKRVSDQTYVSDALHEYVEAKELMHNAQIKLKGIEDQITINQDEIEMCLADIEDLDIKYKQSGGITQEVWNKKIQRIKNEEKKREILNTELKRWINDMVPFLILRQQIIKLKSQIELENNSLKYDNFCDVLDSVQVQNVLNRSLKFDNTLILKMKEEAFNEYGSKSPRVLDLSFEKSALLLALTNDILMFDQNKIIKHKKDIKRSVKTSAKIRQELENSSILQVQEYVTKRTELLERKSELLNAKINFEQELLICKENHDIVSIGLQKAQSALEVYLKKTSINDIAAKSIIMLDRLQQSLYTKQIIKVQKLFKAEIKMLMRKSQFIDDIYIDNDFMIHIYKKEVFTYNQLVLLLEKNTKEQLISLLGNAAVDELIENSGYINEFDFVMKIKQKFKGRERVEIPIEIDKMSLSNGEKQIFIMALYHSLVQLCNLEIPFIIDTPFARIDTEHRHNISEYFFKKLGGQVFILSTNEEVDASHIQLLKDKIVTTYILENSDNKITRVHKDLYFEEEL